ncbi:hypothetical protein DPMN_183735 [Dreissena polymorpha]|uniref:Uncharacterized protein n=1 Tax=Dreissena polymorpha TaxID=45954 RepID=A0A9D4DJI9_DREPO|nr:hypothetical protein DPMN_183735 [Dreissena polymorpha]
MVWVPSGWLFLASVMYFPYLLYQPSNVLPRNKKNCLKLIGECGRAGWLAGGLAGWPAGWRAEQACPGHNFVVHCLALSWGSKVAGLDLGVASRLKRRLPNEDEDGRSEKQLVLGCCTI